MAVDRPLLIMMAQALWSSGNFGTNDIDQGEGYAPEDFALSIHTSTGIGGVLRARMNDNGGIEEVETVSAGTGYQIYDTYFMVLKSEAVDPYQVSLNGQLIDYVFWIRG